MKTVLVTGASGFIGKNLCARLRQEEVKLLAFTKTDSKEKLEQFVKEADFIFHLAGVNRPKDEKEFDEGNRGLTEDLLGLIATSDKKPGLLITSSTQAVLDNPYGKSKQAAEAAVREASLKHGFPTYIYRLTNVFGKWCKPNYNSVVATFCDNIANGREIKISDESTKLTLVYVDDVVDEFMKALDGKPTPAEEGYFKVTRTFDVTLGELSKKLYGFEDIRKTLVIPNFEDAFDRFLYATYTSYLPVGEFAYGLDMKSDERGWLAEFIKSPSGGQIFTSRTKPGFSRGNHWHHTKIEKFLVLDGEAEVTLRDLNSSEVQTYKVTGEELRVVDIPAGYVHAIKNVGRNDLLTLIWADEIFDPSRPDTYYLEV